MEIVVLILGGVAIAAVALAIYERRKKVVWLDETQHQSPQTEADRQALRTQSEIDARVHGSGGTMF